MAGGGLRCATLLKRASGGRGLRPRTPIIYHPSGSGCRPGDQIRNQRCLGQVLPVFLRHLAGHRIDLQPRRVEDAGVIGLPRRLQRVRPRRLRLQHTRRKPRLHPIPMQAQLRRQDRKPHVGEAPHEEPGVQPHDMMVRLEPRRKALALRVRHLAKPHERPHLVDIPPHRLGHQIEPPHQQIGTVLQQLRPRLQHQQRPVQQGKTLRIAVTDHPPRQLRKRLRHPQLRLRLGQRRVAQQVAHLALDPPGHIPRRNARRDQPARGMAKAVEVIGGREGDRVQEEPPAAGALGPRPPFR